MISQFGTSGDDVGQGVAADSSGNVFIGGYTTGALGGPNAGSADGFVREYSKPGKLKWTRQFGGSGYDAVTAVAVDTSGNVCAVGITYDAGTNSGGYDAFVRAYSKSGKLNWTRQFGTSASDWVQGVAVDRSGEVYAVGYTTGAFSGFTSAGGYDGLLAETPSSSEEPDRMVVTRQERLVTLRSPVMARGRLRSAAVPKD